MSEAGNDTAMVERVPRGAPAKPTSENFADSVMDFLADEAPAKPARQAKPDKTLAAADALIQPSKGPRDVALPGDDDDEDADYGGVDQEPDGGADGNPDNDVEESRAAPQHDDKPKYGAREKPYPGKDLPKDQYVEVTVDGEKTVVDFAELARGYIGFQTTQRRLTMAHEFTKKAEGEVRKAQAFSEKVRASVDELFSNDDHLYQFLLDNDKEDVLLRVAQRMADRIKRFREDPHALYAERSERERRRTEAERQRLETEREQLAEQRRQQAVFEERAAIFKPGWAEGLKLAGFPELNDQTGKELFEEVMLRFNHAFASGQQVTPRTVAEMVVRACRALDIKPRGQTSAPPRAPARAPVVEQRRPARGNGSDRWKDAPYQRRQNDPDFFLEKAGLSPREFRR